MINFIFLVLLFSLNLFSGFSFNFSVLKKQQPDEYSLVVTSSRKDDVIVVNIKSEDELPKLTKTFDYQAHFVDYTDRCNRQIRQRISFHPDYDHLGIYKAPDQLCLILKKIQEKMFNEKYLSLGMESYGRYIDDACKKKRKVEFNKALFIKESLENLGENFHRCSFFSYSSKFIPILKHLGWFSYENRLNELGKKMHNSNDVCPQEIESLKQEILALSEDIVHDFFWDIFLLWGKDSRSLKSDLGFSCNHLYRYFWNKKYGLWMFNA